MKISLIICAHNEEKYIAETLTYAIKNSHGQFHEIMVVDNASTDSTALIAKSFQEVRVISEPAKGLTKARQKGLSESTGDVLAYIDADTHMPKGWVETVVKNFNKGSDIVAVSGPYIYFGVSPFMKFIVKVYWLLARIPYFFGGYMMVGGNFVAKKEALLKIGGFDTSIAFYGEDTDIARRLHSVGRIIFSRHLVMPTSARRFHGEGVIHVGWLYITNYFSILFRGKPTTSEYKDIR
jgi:glycosyltransferase involved in cell wall biosynthesis